MCCGESQNRQELRVPSVIRGQYTAFYLTYVLVVPLNVQMTRAKKHPTQGKAPFLGKHLPNLLGQQLAYTLHHANWL